MSSNAKKIPKLLGILLLLGGSVILGKLFFVPLSQEFAYFTNHRSQKDAASQLQPPNTDYAIVIPKIGAAAPIVTDVDPLDSIIYQKALTKGVAHAKGTSHPGENGKIFLFAHSSADLFIASKYNSVFYLVHHLSQGDEIKLWYQGIEHRYQVSSKEYVEASQVEYLTEKSSAEILTLMTCWPPGTTIRRLVIQATKLN